MTPVPQTQNEMDRRRASLRARKHKIHVETNELSEESMSNKTKKLCKLCKPLSVSLTKLSPAQLTKRLRRNTKETQKDKVEKPQNIRGTVKRQQEIQEGNTKKLRKIEEDNIEPPRKASRSVPKRFCKNKNNNFGKPCKSQENNTEEPSKVQENSVEKPNKIQRNSIRKPSKIEENNVRKRSKTQESNTEKESTIQENNTEKGRETQENNIEKPSKIQEKNVKRLSNIHKDNLEKQHESQENNVEEPNQIQENDVKRLSSRQTRSLEERHGSQEDNAVNPSKIQENNVASPTKIQGHNVEEPSKIQEITVKRLSRSKKNNLEQQHEGQEEKAEKHHESEGDKAEKQYESQEENAVKPSVIQENNVGEPSKIQENNVKRLSTSTKNNLEEQHECQGDKAEKHHESQGDKVEKQHESQEDKGEKPSKIPGNSVEESSKIQEKNVKRFSETQKDNLEKQHESQEGNAVKPSIIQENNVEEPSKIQENNVEKPTKTQEHNVEEPSKVHENNVKRLSRSKKNLEEQHESQENNVEEPNQIQENNVKRLSSRQTRSLEERHESQEDNAVKPSKIQENNVGSPTKIQGDNVEEPSKIQEITVKRLSRSKKNNLEEQHESQEDKAEKHHESEGDKAEKQHKSQEDEAEKPSKIQENNVEKSCEIQENNSGRLHEIKKPIRRKARYRCIWDQKRCVKKRKKCIAKSNEEIVQNESIDLPDSENSVQSQIDVASEEEISEDHMERTESLLKSIKQPSIRLHRIDEVINKIAQTFAKVITTKECEASPTLQQVTETETSRDLQTVDTETCNFSNDESLQTSDCASSNKAKSSDNDDISTVNKLLKGKWRRKRRVLYFSDDSDNDNDDNDTEDVQEIISKELKRLKTLDESKTGEAFVTVEEDNIIGETEKDAVEVTDSNEIEVQTLPSPKELDVHDELCDLPDKENLEDISNSRDVEMGDSNVLENISSKSYGNDSIDESIKEGSASNSVSSQLNLIEISKDDASRTLEASNSMSAEEPITESNDALQQTPEPFCPDVCLTEKYKLYKDVRVFLINFDSIKGFLNNKFSAAEIEQVIKTHMNLLINSNSIHAPLFGKETYTVCETSLSDISDKFVSPVSSKGTKREGRWNSESPKHSSSHRELWEIATPEKKAADYSCASSDETSTHQRLKMKFRLLFPKDESVEKDTEPAATKKLHSLLKEKTQEVLSGDESPLKSLNDAKDPKNTEVCISNRSKPKIISSATVTIGNLLNYSENLVPSKQRTVSIISHPRAGSSVEINKASPKKHTTASTSFDHIPPKHKKDVDSGKEILFNYKCIICDLCFNDYIVLQQHLLLHRRKQNDVPSDSSETSKVPKGTAPRSSVSEITYPVKSPSGDDHQPSISRSKSNASSVSSGGLNKEETRTKNSDSLNKSKVTPSKKRSPKLKVFKQSNDCAMCGQVFPRKYDLAAHIFLHTERELKEAFANAENKLHEMSEVRRRVRKRKKERLAKKKKERLRNEKKKRARNEKKERASSKEFDESASKETRHAVEETVHTGKAEKVLVRPETRVVEETNGPELKSTVPEEGNQPRKSTGSKETESTELQRLSAQGDIEKEKSSRAISQKKCITTCECHNETVIGEDSLQIEIVLLCHVCKILFRSMECFETHYRLPEHSVCNQDRLKNGRSPNLFCANCGMLFDAVQDLRQHLEVHARFKEQFTMDFRCNICKVIFIGIGSLFYIHWSKHSKDPLWIASEQSFPRGSVVKPKAKSKRPDQALKPVDSTSNDSTDTYIVVAEYVCSICRSPCATECLLQKHESQCKGSNENAVENSNASAKTLVPKIRLICSLCADTFCNKPSFYQHTRKIHKFCAEPQYICVSLAASKKAFLCNVCTDLSMNMSQFEAHWSKHSRTREYFACTRCSDTCDSYESFQEHAGNHKSGMKDDTLLCKVLYREKKFVCKVCNIGFSSKKSFDEHSLLQVHSQATENDPTSEQTNATAGEETNNVSVTSESIDSIEMHLRKSVQTEVDAKNKQQTETRNEGRGAEVENSLERETLINILEGNEDDSEHELVIDLTDHQEDSNQVLKEDRSKEKQPASVAPSNVPSVIQVSKDSAPITSRTTVLTATQNVPVTVSSKPPVTSAPQNSNSAPKLARIVQQAQALNLSSSNANDSQSVPPGSAEAEKKVAQSVENNDAPNAVSSEVREPAAPAKKRGFIRVKNISELIAKTVPSNQNSQLCEYCARTFDNAELLANHVKAHRTPYKTESQAQTSTRTLQPQPSSNPDPALKRLLLVKGTQPVKTTNSTVFRTTANAAPASSSYRIQQTPAARPPPLYASAQSSMPAYHKNLPACNIIRTTTAIPRSALLRSEAAFMQTAATSADVQNVQSTYTTPSISEFPRPSSTTTSNLHRNTMYNCRLCPGFHTDNLSTFLMHELSEMHNKNRDAGSDLGGNCPANQAPPNRNLTASNQNIVQAQLYSPDDLGVKHIRTSPDYNYPYHLVVTDPSNATSQQAQQISLNQPVSGNTSSFYYKNTNAGGMSIVINQTTPGVHEAPIVNALQQQEQERMYEPQGYRTQVNSVDYPYVQQSQTVIDLSEPSNVPQLTRNPYSVAGTVTKYALTVQPPAHVCAYCPKTVCFLSEEQLKLHTRSKHYFVCKICAQRFYNFDELNVHVAIHKFV